MQDPDPKCRHFGILWHYGNFAKKSDRKSDPIFPILSDFFRFLDFSRLPTFRFHSSIPNPFALPPASEAGNLSNLSYAVCFIYVIQRSAICIVHYVYHAVAS